jgi:4-amino-4-deoxy-L-arabinose transferase-like glycosyltransferase
MTQRTRARKVANVVTSGRLLILVVVLGAVLRLYRFDALSLWLDEGFTVFFSRLPWRTVLGLDGAYDVHPPLYYALVKVVGVGVPEVVAGRLVSVVAGTATVPVLYALAARLLGPWPGVLSALVLAVSPLHVWYSQEARQYALVVLLVCVSYLALTEYWRSPRMGWAALYLVTLLLALYTEYSAIYAILPQALVLAATVVRQRQRAIPLVGAVAGAVLSFLPWLPQLLGVAGNVSNQGQFVVTPVRVASSLLSIMGLAAPLYGRGEQGGAAAVATSQAIQMPDSALIYAIPLLCAVPSMVVGLAALARTRRPATPSVGAGFAVPLEPRRLSRVATLPMLVMFCLLVGTVASAVLLSLIYPGYVKRTILSAVLGWAILLGAAPFAVWLPPALRVVGRASVVFCLGASLVVTGLTYANADKQHWRELAADMATSIRQARAGGSPYLLITYPTITDTLIDVYEPDVLDTSHVQIPDGGSLTGLPDGPLPQSVWLAYIEIPGAEAIHSQLQALGYTRVSHDAYPDTMYLDAYRLSGR